MSKWKELEETIPRGDLARATSVLTVLIRLALEAPELVSDRAMRERVIRSESVCHLFTAYSDGPAETPDYLWQFQAMETIAECLFSEVFEYYGCGEEACCGPYGLWRHSSPYWLEELKTEMACAPDWSARSVRLACRNEEDRIEIRNRARASLAEPGNLLVTVTEDGRATAYFESAVDGARFAASEEEV